MADMSLLSQHPVGRSGSDVQGDNLTLLLEQCYWPSVLLASFIKLIRMPEGRAPQTRNALQSDSVL